MANSGRQRIALFSPADLLVPRAGPDLGTVFTRTNTEHLLKRAAKMCKFAKPPAESYVCNRALAQVGVGQITAALF